MPALCVSIMIAPTIILHVQYCGRKKPMEHLAVVTACIKSTVKIYSGQLLPLTTHLDKCSELEQVLQSTVFNSHLSQSSDYQ